MRPALVLSCEHGGTRVPRGFPRTPAFDALLPTHRGWDPGALHLARRMARLLGAPLRYSTISRLVVEPNRDEGGAEVFSPWSAALPCRERRRLLARYHRRHRARVRRAVEAASEGGRRPVVHLGVHTFTPVLDGVVRSVEVGILLDPDRPLERQVSHRWMAELAHLRPELEIRENEPYDGRSEGLTTTLRHHFPREGSLNYAGLELEVSQGLLGRDGRFPDALAAALAGSLASALDSSPGGAGGGGRPTRSGTGSRPIGRGAAAPGLSAPPTP